MRLVFRASILGLCLAAMPAMGESGHGGASGGAAIEPTLEGDFSVGIEGVPSSAPNGSSYSTSIENWFQEYALQRSIDEKKALQKQLEETAAEAEGDSVIVVQKKSVRRVVPNFVTVEKSTLGGSTSTSALNAEPLGSKGAGQASASINQTLSPNIVINNLLPATASNSLSSPEVEQSAFAAKVEEISAKPRKETGKLNIIELSEKDEAREAAGENRVVRSLSQFFTHWFGGSPNAKSSTQRRLGSRFLVVSDEEGDSQADPARELTRQEASIGSSGSWFGWIGWVVALLLLGLLVWGARQSA